MRLRPLWALLLAVGTTTAHGQEGTGCTDGIEQALRTLAGKPALEDPVVAAHCKP